MAYKALPVDDVPPPTGPFAVARYLPDDDVMLHKGGYSSDGSDAQGAAACCNSLLTHGEDDILRSFLFLVAGLVMCWAGGLTGCLFWLPGACFIRSRNANARIAGALNAVLLTLMALLVLSAIVVGSIWAASLVFKPKV